MYQSPDDEHLRFRSGIFIAEYEQEQTDQRDAQKLVDGVISRSPPPLESSLELEDVTRSTVAHLFWICATVLCIIWGFLLIV